MLSSARDCRPAQQLIAGLFIVLTCVTAACGARSINQLLADPTKYRNQSVTVRGTVAESASIAGRGAYRITDGDQGLWVVTTTGAPRRGARVDVTGRLQDGYDLGAFGNLIKLPGSLQSALVLVESSHKAH
jgi:membrane protein implicated in regulation of membrane protease activity